LDDVEKDLQGIKFDIWRQKAVDREEWLSVTEETYVPRVQESQINN
jgi:hypothetical protein